MELNERINNFKYRFLYLCISEKYLAKCFYVKTYLVLSFFNHYVSKLNKGNVCIKSWVRYLITVPHCPH